MNKANGNHNQIISLASQQKKKIVLSHMLGFTIFSIIVAVSNFVIVIVITVIVVDNYIVKQIKS